LKALIAADQTKKRLEGLDIFASIHSAGAKKHKTDVSLLDTPV